jgi:hypothetical protein
MGSGPNDTAPVTNGPVPSVALKPAGPAADPFAGSPAEGYADGKAGIVIPVARPVGQFSAAQVANDGDLTIAAARGMNVATRPL